LGDPNTVGLCVDANTIVNDPETLTQQGVEVSFQYDLSSWEDRLGGFDWASGFGVLALVEVRISSMRLTVLLTRVIL